MTFTEEQLARLAGLEQAFRREITLSKPNVNQIIQINKQFHFNAYAAAQMAMDINSAAEVILSNNKLKEA